MPVATPKQFEAMLDAAQEGGYAYPAINCSRLVTINAALKAYADMKSDGIIQFSTGAGQFASGLNHKNTVLGTIALAELTHRLAEQYDVLVALNTDHCRPHVAPDFLDPLIEATAQRRARGENNLFQNHMLDASELALDENLEISKKYLAKCAENEIVLEVEACVVGGEEEGAAGTEDTPDEDLYTTPEDMMAVYEALHPLGRFTFAATFGNVHGHYKPGAVKLRPEILKQGQEAVTGKYGADAEFDLVFHGGSGSTLEEIRETLDYGVVKMNVDTDTQYAFTRPIASHMFQNYDGVLKVDGGVGNKKQYDPRAWGKVAESAMAARVVESTRQLGSYGQSKS